MSILKLDSMYKNGHVLLMINNFDYELNHTVTKFLIILAVFVVDMCLYVVFIPFYVRYSLVYKKRVVPASIRILLYCFLFVCEVGILTLFYMSLEVSPAEFLSMQMKPYLRGNSEGKYWNFATFNITLSFIVAIFGVFLLQVISMALAVYFNYKVIKYLNSDGMQKRHNRMYRGIQNTMIIQLISHLFMLLIPFCFVILFILLGISYIFPFLALLECGPTVIMSQQQPRGNFNPNAQSFIPNANAMPFIPGQRYVPPQQQFYPNQMYPPGYGQMYGNQMMYMPPGQRPQQQQQQQQQQPMQIGQWQQPPQVPQQPPVQQAQVPPKTSEPPKQEPAESWDDGADVPVEPPKPAKPAAPAKDTETPKPEPPAPKEEKPKEPKPPREIKEASVESVPVPIRAVNIDEIEKTHKEHINIVFIGHVDAGKSTIGGQIMYLTGMVDKRTLEKYEREAKEKGRESWYLSWALDTNDEEREKGKTVDVGRAFFETEKKRFTILDAPGHKSFVPNMITGATQADLAVLVISARKGEFETGFDRGGQTREHAMLAKTAGVKHLIILVNKMDDSTVNWDEARYKEIQDKLSPFLRKCGFGKNDITYIPCSGLKGDFLKERPDGVGLWYSGQCFLEFIDNMAKISRDYGGPVRMIVSEKYMDMGTIVIGKIESGVVVKGQNLVLMPNKVPVQVLQCWNDEDEVDEVVAGDSVKLKLKGVEEADILSGFIICSPEAPCRVGKIFDAEVFILEHKSIIAPGYTCVLHLHTAVEEVTVARIICKIDKKTNEKIKGVKFVKQDDKCIMRIESQEPFCLDTFKEFPAMARFTLRDEGKTIGIGKVVKMVE